MLIRVFVLEMIDCNINTTILVCLHCAIIVFHYAYSHIALVYICFINNSFSKLQL